jgi:hypothetical protein
VRYELRSKEILRWVMDHPGRGVPFSIRALASAIGRHPSLVGHLLTGERDDAESEDAQAISEAVGVALLVLFAPPASPNQNGAAPEK